MATEEVFATETAEWIEWGFPARPAQSVRLVTSDLASSYDQHYAVVAEIEAYGEGLTSGQVQLSWIAPGDDGSTGTAAQYEVFRHDAPFTADTLDDATRLDGLLTPRAGGSLETVVVNGLEGEATTYWAVRAVDDAGLTGPLSSVALYHLGELRHVEAWRDVSAMLRLTAPCSEGRNIVNQLVAAAIGGLALDATQQLLADPGLPPALARSILADLRAQPNATQMLRSLDTAERLLGIQLFIDVAADPAGLLGFIDSDYASALSQSRIDWNVLLKDYNTQQDAIVAAAKVKPFVARQAAFDAIATNMDARAARVAAPTAMKSGLMGTGTRSKLVSDLILTSFSTPPKDFFVAEDRVIAQLQLTKIAAALAVYRAEQGSYPKTLEALVPDLLPTKPIDTMHGKPIDYRRTDDGYLLYSRGPNGVDDGGSNAQLMLLAGEDVGGNNWSDADESDPVDPDTGEPLWQQVPAGADDLSVRVPIPVEPWPWERPGS